MNTPQSILDVAVKYLRIYTLSMISVVIYNLLCGILRAIGDSKSPMMFQIFGGIVNVIADFIFIVILKMDVQGAAIATLLSQTLTAVLTIRYFYKRSEEPKLHFTMRIFDKKIFKKILMIGIPAGVQSIVITLSNIIIQSQINSFGVDAIAAFTAYFKIELILYLPIIVLGQALVSFVGQNYGAKQYDRINKGVKYSMIVSVVITMGVSTLMIINSNYIFSIFTSNRTSSENNRLCISVNAVAEPTNPHPIMAAFRKSIACSCFIFTLLLRVFYIESHRSSYSMQTRTSYVRRNCSKV